MNDILQCWRVLQQPYQWDSDETGVPDTVWFVEVKAHLKDVPDKIEPFEIPFSSFNDAYEFHKILEGSFDLPLEVDLGDAYGGDNVTYMEYVN